MNRYYNFLGSTMASTRPFLSTPPPAPLRAPPPTAGRALGRRLPVGRLRRADDPLGLVQPAGPGASAQRRGAAASRRAAEVERSVARDGEGFVGGGMWRKNEEKM